MKNIIIAIFILYISLLGALDEYYINKISFQGNSTISSTRLQKNLILKSRNFIQKIFFWTHGSVYNEIYLEEDVEQIISDYQREGFLQVEVRVETEFDREDHEVDLYYIIEEKEPVSVKDINLNVIVEPAELQDSVRSCLRSDQEMWLFSQGSRFRDMDVLSLKEHFFSRLLNNGFPSPELDQDIVLSKDYNEADVIYNISPGSRCRFGEVKIIGNNRTPSKVIKKQISFNGDLFSQIQLEETQRRIQQLGIFQFVTMKSLIDQIASSQIPVEILVSELPEWSVKFGIGYGLEDRFRTSVDLLKLNFLGGARRANLYLKHSYLEPYNISLKIIQPAFLGPYGSLSFTPFLKEEHESAYDLESFGASVTFQNIITSSLNGFISYKFERSFIDLNNDSEGDLLDKYYNKSAFSQGFSFDNSIPAFYPEKGISASYTATLSGLKLSSKYHYLQGLIDLRKYRQIFPGFVLAGKLKIGSMKPIWGDDITPVEERFYAGGSSSIRGWARSKVGPENENGSPVGGESYLEFSLEARQKIHKMLYLVLFLDGGNVWEEYNEHDPNDLKYSPGAGIRIKTPIGPIRLDAAQPVWDSKKRIQLHLSIGQAF